MVHVAVNLNLDEILTRMLVEEVQPLQDHLSIALILQGVITVFKDI